MNKSNELKGLHISTYVHESKIRSVSIIVYHSNWPLTQPSLVSLSLTLSKNHLCLPKAISVEIWQQIQPQTQLGLNLNIQQNLHTPVDLSPERYTPNYIILSSSRFTLSSIPCQFRTIAIVQVSGPLSQLYLNL